jgi:hypothetical protein
LLLKFTPLGAAAAVAGTAAVEGAAVCSRVPQVAAAMAMVPGPVSLCVDAFGAHVGLEIEEVSMQHSLSYLSQAFSVADGRPIQRMMIEMADWPQLLSGGTALYAAVHSVGGLVPLFVPLLGSGNKGIWTMFEGKHKRHMRLVGRMPGYRPAQPCELLSDELV